MTQTYRTYPLRSVALYIGLTVVHFGLGALGLFVAYGRWPVAAWFLTVLYLVVAFGQMYVLMPLLVCPSCVYRRMSGGRCVSGLNLLSAGITASRPLEDFAARRAEGWLCHNNLYLGSLIAPIPLVGVGLIFNFSWIGLALLLAVAGLLAFRVMVVFFRTACPHCAAKARCPNAKSMGIA